MSEADINIIDGIIKGENKAYSELYDLYYSKLCSFSYQIVKDLEAAEEIVQSLIYSIWENRKNFAIKSDLKTYLYTSVQYNSIRFNKKKAKHNRLFTHEEATEFDIGETTNHEIEVHELRHAINSAVKKLPTQTQQIFRLSRDEKLTYKEIACKTSISPKTVEYHISKAIKSLHSELHDYLTVFITFVTLSTFY